MAGFPVLDVLKNLPGFQAGGTNRNPFGDAVNQGADFLQVRVPAPFGDIVGVGYVIAVHRLLAAYFTNFSHFSTSTPFPKK